MSYQNDAPTSLYFLLLFFETDTLINVYHLVSHVQPCLILSLNQYLSLSRAIRKGVHSLPIESILLPRITL